LRGCPLSAKAKTPISARTGNISVAAFAAATDLSTSTVRNMILRGEVRGVHIGRAVRIPVSEFARLGLDLPAVLEEADAR